MAAGIFFSCSLLKIKICDFHKIVCEVGSSYRQLTRSKLKLTAAMYLIVQDQIMEH